jgi:hypothetical protein
MEVIGLIGIVLALLQLNLQQQQFNYERAHELRLEYSYGLSLSEADQKVIAQAASGLAEEFYRKLHEQTQTNTTSYLS